MIITKTPFRMSFVGGGTDLPSFYTSKEGEFGAVVSSAIDKYMYIALHKFFDDQILLKYSQTELVKTVEEIQHPLIRESMKMTGVDRQIEITSFSDIPSKGSGLGSSSAFTVGLLNALYHFKGKENVLPNVSLAEQACDIEIDRLSQPIGKQDQYGVALGGFNYIRFNAGGSVDVEPLLKGSSLKEELGSKLLLFYTGQTRSASAILKDQQQDMGKKMKSLLTMRDFAVDLRDQMRDGRIEAFGELLHKNWELKKSLSTQISGGAIDGWYSQAISAGAIGGKLLGAGGGGFLVFYVDEEKQDAVRSSLSDLHELPFSFDDEGSRVIYPV